MIEKGVSKMLLLEHKKEPYTPLPKTSKPAKDTAKSTHKPKLTIRFEKRIRILTLEEIDDNK
jgi:hypothetical protein